MFLICTIFPAVRELPLSYLASLQTSLDILLHLIKLTKLHFMNSLNNSKGDMVGSFIKQVIIYEELNPEELKTESNLLVLLWRASSVPQSVEISFQHWAQSFSWKSQGCVWFSLLHCWASAYGFPIFFLSPICIHKVWVFQDLENYLGSLVQLPLPHWGKYYPSFCPKNETASATQISCSLYAKEKQYEL